MVSPGITPVCTSVLLMVSTPDPIVVVTTPVSVVPLAVKIPVFVIVPPTLKLGSTKALRYIAPDILPDNVPISRVISLPEIVVYGGVPDPTNVNPELSISVIVTPVVTPDPTCVYVSTYVIVSPGNTPLCSNVFVNNIDPVAMNPVFTSTPVLPEPLMVAALENASPGLRPVAIIAVKKIEPDSPEPSDIPVR